MTPSHFLTLFPPFFRGCFRWFRVVNQSRVEILAPNIEVAGSDTIANRDAWLAHLVVTPSELCSESHVLLLITLYVSVQGLECVNSHLVPPTPRCPRLEDTSRYRALSCWQRDGSMQLAS